MKAFFVSLHGNEAITFAKSRSAARFNMVRSYWDAFGRSREFPNVTARRARELDDITPPQFGSVFDIDYIRSLRGARV